jgi:parvulin-like peptidyl-prolyl isomerase
MYKEKITTAVTCFSSLMLLTLLFVPTVVVSRQRLTDNKSACEETKEVKKVEEVKKTEKKANRYTIVKKPAASVDSPISAPVAQGKPSKKAVLFKEEEVKKETVNEIAVLIYNNVPSQSGSDSKEFEKAPDIVLTRLDLERPSIDGRKRTVEELVNDHLMNSEAVFFYRMIVPEDAVDKYINSIKEQHHLSDDQLRGMFKEVGYTYDEGRTQLAMGQAIDSLLNFKIRSRLVVLEKDVRAYYDAHPVYEEASYRIKKGFIPEGIFTEEELNQATAAMMKNPAIQWSTSYWLLEDEITDERKEMLRAMKQGSYSHLEPATGGYEVIQLMQVKPRALKSFEDRYREISSILQEPQYYKLLDELKKELLDKYEVVYFN